MARARGWWPIALIVTALVVINVASNRLVPKGGYVAWAVASTALLLWLARRVDGRSWDELGLARSTWRRGLRWGGVLVGTVLAVYVVAVALPATQDLFRDERVEGWTLGQSLWAALVRVPFGTVLLEEVAFRAVLPAVLLARTRTAVAVGASAVLFGLWHVLPALGLSSVNPVADDTVGQLPTWVTVAASVGSTALVGVWFWWLRDRSRSLLAPMALHWATNGLGYLFAYAAWSR
ncbi:MAG: CPBP family intramembrane metalloprotease [Actinobacteria bacterium]|nr:CPBP family intramembrane metalloprotease [Actinomycetota bacterium]